MSFWFLWKNKDHMWLPLLAWFFWLHWIKILNSSLPIMKWFKTETRTWADKSISDCISIYLRADENLFFKRGHTKINDFELGWRFLKYWINYFWANFQARNSTDYQKEKKSHKFWRGAENKYDDYGSNFWVF